MNRLHAWDRSVVRQHLERWDPKFALQLVPHVTSGVVPPGPRPDPFADVRSCQWLGAYLPPPPSLAHLIHDTFPRVNHIFLILWRVKDGGDGLQGGGRWATESADHRSQCWCPARGCQLPGPRPRRPPPPPPGLLFKSLALKVDESLAPTGSFFIIRGVRWRSADAGFAVRRMPRVWLEGGVSPHPPTTRHP